MPSNKVKAIKQKHDRLKKAKQAWNPLFQLIGEYVHNRKQNFMTSHVKGTMLNEQLFDNTAVDANEQFASLLVGNLWPNGAKSFYVGAPLLLEKMAQESAELKHWYDTVVTRQMVEALDDPKVRLSEVLDEYMLDQGSFGTAGIGVFEDEDDEDVPFFIRPYDAKRACIEENHNGIVDTVYNEEEKSVRQVVMEYGINNVSKTVRTLFEKGQHDEFVKVLHALEPRLERDPTKFGAKDMPYASIHVECESGKVLRERGYPEQPVFIVRYRKAMGEVWGRSQGMAALPDILEQNVLREAFIIAQEKSLDPPIGVRDDTTVGGNVIDTSAGAVTVFSVSGRIDNSSRLVEPLIDVGDMNPVRERIQELNESIRNKFYLDRLLDFNNETQMTFGEARLRDNLRGQSLNTVFARQIGELLVPLLERVFNIMWRRNKFGFMPESPEAIALAEAGLEPGVDFPIIPEVIAKMIVEGRNFYKINFISPAARIMSADEVNGIMQSAEFVSGVAALNPEVVDNYDLDGMVRRFGKLSGLPETLINATETMKQLREARQAQQQAMAEAELARSGSETARNLAQAEQTVKQ